MIESEPVQSVDLSYHINFGVQSLVNSLDEDKGFAPILYYWLLKEPPYGQHSEWDIPNMVCRTLDALLLAESAAKVSIDANVERALTDLLFNSFSSRDWLPWRPLVPASYMWYSESGSSSPPMVCFHDLKDVLLALTDIFTFRKSEIALDLAGKLCRSIENLTSDSRGFKSYLYGEDGWIKLDAASKWMLAPTLTSGRLIMALVEYYRATKDPSALRLARKFTDFNLEVCFTERGELTDEAGVHVHSITGTIASVINFGLLLNERRYVEMGRRIYDVGITPYRSSFGWMKENRLSETDEGEICCTADLIEAALLLGVAGYPQYFEDAERMIRNHLLECQLLDISWVKKPEDLPAEEGKIYKRLLNRVKGSFAGWCLPNDFSSGRMPEVQMCCTAHAVHALCKAFEKAVTLDEAGLRVNLLFTKDSEYLTIKSFLPETGRVEIIPHTSANLFVRIPSWVKPDELEVYVSGRKSDITIQGSYLLIPKLSVNTKIEINFPQVSKTVHEMVNGKTYTVRWLGDTVKSIKPGGKFAPLYAHREWEVS